MLDEQSLLCCGPQELADFGSYLVGMPPPTRGIADSRCRRLLDSR